MRFHTLCLIFVLAILVTSAVLNWTVFIAPTELSLGFTHVQMPLGFAMLGCMLFLSISFFKRLLMVGVWCKIDMPCLCCYKLNE